MTTPAALLKDDPLNQDPEAEEVERELHSYFVRVSDLCRLIKNTPRVEEETKRQLIAAFRSRARGSLGLPYYTFPLIIGEVEARVEVPGVHAPKKGQTEEVLCDFQRVMKMIRQAGPEHLPVLVASELLVH